MVYNKKLDVALTMNCNLRCKHCLLGNRLESGESIKKEVLIKVLQEGVSLGVKDLLFTGGEPLVYKDILEVLKIASKLGYNVSINTNGTLINESMAKALADISLYKIQVSIEGPQKVHDYIRGNGTFDRAINGIKLVKKYGIKVYLNTQLTEQLLEKENFKEYMSLLELIEPELVQLTVTASLGNAKKFDIKPIDYNKHREFINFLAEQTRSYVQERRKDREDLACSAVFYEMAIDSNGNAYPCHYFRGINQYSIGNVYNEELKDIWNRGMKTPLADFIKGKLISEECKKCAFLKESSRCAAKIYDLYQRFDVTDPMDCYLNRGIFSKDLKLLFNTFNM